MGCGDQLSKEEKIEMKIVKWFAVLCLAAAACDLAEGQEFRPYAAARLDPKASQQASGRGAKCEVYTTTDAFEKVYAWYKSLYKEYAWPVRPPKLPSGKEIQWAYFILDGGKDLAHSKYWMKVQRPYIGTVDEGTLDFTDIRDLTVIQTVRRN